VPPRYSSTAAIAAASAFTPFAVAAAIAQPAAAPGHQEAKTFDLWVISDQHVGTDKAASEGIQHGLVGFRPPPVRAEQYQLEYGTARLEIPAEGIELAGRSVVIVDDVLATGGTVAAAQKLLEQGGALVTMAAVVLELAALGGRGRVAPLPVHSLRVM